MFHYSEWNGNMAREYFVQMITSYDNSASDQPPGPIFTLLSLSALWGRVTELVYHVCKHSTGSTMPLQTVVHLSAVPLSSILSFGQVESCFF